MVEQNLITAQQYAIKHKMSTFAVLKLINAKTLKTIKKSVHNEEIEFIIDETLPSNTTIQNEATTKPDKNETIDYEVEFHKLLSKYIELQEKYTRLIEEKSHATK
ncbi:hypothetical protein [Sulfurospirillum diekertiae]|uniref:Uncharacterized protein n=1 Tax=Sulfurospirillum diekertiae TaxID=1854492 RepID=A0A1Y0HLE0_9BACT|nr:hypothetical protein [Sulfurospirillum diekertiae]ARU48919.1 hypothetical protein Sdiek1_1760 [Sulfurospirillum diekertiae]ASC93738.1 hypothetical protein Sdiek2_1723 [Sulfurospirillum diekertiae]